MYSNFLPDIIYFKIYRVSMVSYTGYLLTATMKAYDKKSTVTRLPAIDDQLVQRYNKRRNAQQQQQRQRADAPHPVTTSSMSSKNATAESINSTADPRDGETETAATETGCDDPRRRSTAAPRSRRHAIAKRDDLLTLSVARVLGGKPSMIKTGVTTSVAVNDCEVSSEENDCHTQPMCTGELDDDEQSAMSCDHSRTALTNDCGVVDSPNLGSCQSLNKEEEEESGDNSSLIRTSPEENKGLRRKTNAIDNAMLIYWWLPIKLKVISESVKVKIILISDKMYDQ